MIVSYQDQAARALALDDAVAVEWLGEPAAAWLHAMLAEVEAAADAAELFSLYGASARVTGGLLLVEVVPGLSVLFAAVGASGANCADAAIDWNTMRRLKLVEVKADGSGR